VTEHNGKMLCKGCLDKQTAKDTSSKSRRGRALAAKLAYSFLFASAFFSAWLFFYWTGKALASIPQKYHITEAKQ